MPVELYKRGVLHFHHLPTLFVFCFNIVYIVIFRE